MQRRQVMVSMVLALSTVALGFAGCADDGGSSDGLTGVPELAADAVPAFSLIDLNPNSATYDQAVSPRDFLGGLSAWYFGHAT